MPQKLKRKDVIARMREQQGDLIDSDFALELGITKQALSKIYLGKANPGPKVLKKLGLRRVFSYEPAEELAS